MGGADLALSLQTPSSAAAMPRESVRPPQAAQWLSEGPLQPPLRLLPPPAAASSTMDTRKATLAFYALVGLAALVHMIYTVASSPLFPLRPGNLRWTQDWLAFSVRFSSRSALSRLQQPGRTAPPELTRASAGRPRPCAPVALLRRRCLGSLSRVTRRTSFPAPLTHSVAGDRLLRREPVPLWDCAGHGRAEGPALGRRLPAHRLARGLRVDAVEGRHRHTAPG